LALCPSLIDRVAQNAHVNFVLTNWIPRRLATRFIGWFSRLEHPLLVRVSLAVWQRFGGDLNLREARKTHFASLHDCFVRELKDGARPIDSRPDVLVSPCDGIVVACGHIEGTQLLQAKGLTYTLEELLVDPALVNQHRDGTYVTAARLEHVSPLPRPGGLRDPRSHLRGGRHLEREPHRTRANRGSVLQE
jgi:phosphatidylserine decarboxylase